MESVLRRRVTRVGDGEVPVPNDDDTPEQTCVVFSVPERRLAAMDVASGPCVPLPGRKTSVISAHQQQGPERPKQMEALYEVLTGQDGLDSLLLVEEREGSRLYRCSEDFVAAMAEAN